MSDTNNTDDENLTDSYDMRWEWLSSLVALSTALTVPLLIAATTIGTVNLSTIPAPWFALFSIGYAAAVKYSLGRGEFDAIRKMLN